MAARVSTPFQRSSWAFAALFAAALLAFWPVYVSKVGQVHELYVHLHTLGVVAWMGLLIAQPQLVGRGRRRLHRALGRSTYLLVPYIVVTSTLLAHSRFKALDEATFAEVGHSFYFPFIATLLFIAAYGLAIRHRRDMAVHARFMIATALPLIDPIMARLLAFYTSVPGDPLLYALIGYGFTDLVLLALIWLDRREKRARWVFPLLLAVFLVGHLGWFTLAQTRPWFHVAAAFRDLPLS